MDDLISRQAAIDIERNATVDTNPTHFEAHQKFIQFMDDAEISSFGRWQWANGFNMALTAVCIDLKKLPSAQTDAVPVIRCKDCKWYLPNYTKSPFDTDGFDRWGGLANCQNENGLTECSDESYCSCGERRKEE